MSDLDRQANVLGALALVITDRTDDAIDEETGISETAAAALSALYRCVWTRKGEAARSRMRVKEGYLS